MSGVPFFDFLSYTSFTAPIIMTGIIANVLGKNMFSKKKMIFVVLFAVASCLSLAVATLSVATAKDDGGWQISLVMLILRRQMNPWVFQ